jgi:hypothetical protein
MNLSQQMASRLLLLLAWGLSAIGAADSNRPPAQSTVPLNRAEAQAVMVIQAYTDGLAGVRAASPDVHLSVALPLRLSVSFLDRNRVAYTTWTELKGGVWQSVRIPFDEMRPNPYFQPPDAKTGSPIDVSDVKGIAFAPHDQTAGRLTIGKFVVSK